MMAPPFNESLSFDCLKDDEPGLTIDPNKDIRIFASLVAPRLKITKRYFGEGKVDRVTGQYNAASARLLPEYGIEFVEVPRLCLADGMPISASKTRELINLQEWDQLESYPPEGTLAYLKSKSNSNHSMVG